MKLLFIALSTIFFISHNPEAKSKKSKSVTTLLEAKWLSTPLVLEAAEYLADESIDSYWSYIDSISSLNPPLKSIKNDQERYRVMLKHASKLITPAQMSVLKLALSLHIYSPKVQMFGQIAQERKLPECTAVADIGGQLTCDVVQMTEILKRVSILFNKINFEFPNFLFFLYIETNYEILIEFPSFTIIEIITKTGLSLLFFVCSSANSSLSYVRN